MAICTICGFETEFLKQHMTNHGDDRKFQCDKCEKVVTGRKALENHKKSHMSWNCTNCEEVIPHNSRSMHIKRCKKVSNTLSCEKCPYITNAKSNLNRHMKRAGFTPPSKLQLRKNSPYSSPYSSPFSSPSGR